MIDPETAAFVETGAALLVGTVAARRRALRGPGLGLTVLDRANW